MKAFARRGRFVLGVSLVVALAVGIPVALGNAVFHGAFTGSLAGPLGGAMPRQTDAITGTLDFPGSDHSVVQSSLTNLSSSTILFFRADTPGHTISGVTGSGFPCTSTGQGFRCGQLSWPGQRTVTDIFTSTVGFQGNESFNYFWTYNGSTDLGPQPITFLQPPPPPTGTLEQQVAAEIGDLLRRVPGEFTNARAIVVVVVVPVQVLAPGDVDLSIFGNLGGDGQLKALKQVLLASGHAHFGAKGRGTIKVRPTAAGKKLVKQWESRARAARSLRLKVTVVATATPSGGAKVTKTRKLSLKP